MPATDIHASMPSMHTVAGLRYVQDRKQEIREHCVYDRPTKYYIDPDSGSDSNAGTIAAPWATMANVRAAIEGTAGVGSNTWASRVTETAFYVKRGTMLRDSTTTNGGCLVPRSAGLEFGLYGAPIKSATTQSDKFVLSNFTIQWLNGFTVTTPGGATNRRTISLTASATVLNPASATRIGWLRMDRSVTHPLAPGYCSTWNPFTYVSGSAVSAGQDSAAYTLNESTSLSFYTPSAGGVVSVNLGFVDPDTLDITTLSAGTCLEATPYVGTDSANYDGIRIGEGADKCYIWGWVTEGYGCQSESLQNGSGIRFGGGDDDIAYIEDVESYYSGRHALSMESSDTTTGFGGTFYKKSCVVGYCAPAGGANHDVCFSNKGQAEYITEGLEIRFGLLPVVSGITSRYAANTTTGAGQIDKPGVFYAHSGGSGASYKDVVLYWNENSTITDMRDTYPGATVAREGFVFADSLRSETPFLAGTQTDPTTYRVFVVGWKSPRYKLDSAPVTFTGRSRTMFINCHHYYNVGWASPVYIWGAVSNAIWLNSVFEIDYQSTVTVENNLALCLFNQGSSAAVYNRFLNCEFHINGGDVAGYFGITRNQFGGTFGYPMGNCLIVNRENITHEYSGKGLKVCMGAGGFSLADCPSNSSTYLRNIATYGALMANISTGDSNRRASGFDQAANLLNLETANVEVPTLSITEGKLSRIIGDSSPLAGIGAANPFADSLSTLGMIPAPEYDFAFNRRPSTPSVGAFDVISLETGSGGGGEGGSNGVFVGGNVRSPVRP